MALRHVAVPVISGALLLLAALPDQSLGAAELRGSVGIETRWFAANAPYDGAFRTYSSFVVNPEFHLADDSGNHSLTFTPFYRQDSHDEERSHGDIRELYWSYLGQRFEVSAGIRKVFWGATESRHLVDVINQTDLVENLDEEDKLGQPMFSASVLTGAGTLDFYLLPYFRERTFPAADGRLQFLPAALFNRRAMYESGDGDKHVDWALRWSRTMGYWDVGLSHFYGTNREPLFIAGDDIDQLHPYYEVMHQTGLDIQGAVGAWLLKLETIYRDTQSDAFFAATMGFEYTWSQVGQSNLDVGLVAEYLYDGRAARLTPFDDDLMLGIRLSPNDLKGTEFLLGVIEDRDDHGRFYRLEAGRRLTDHLRIDLEATFFQGTGNGDVFFNLRKDDFVQAELAWYF